MAYCLPNPLQPQPGESLPGLIMRNAERYHFRDPTRLFKRLGQGPQLVHAIAMADPTSDFGQEALEVLGLVEDQVRRLALWSDRPGCISINGEPVTRELTGYGVRAVCTECLVESPHHRAVWLVDALPTCGVHGRPLLFRCPACERPLRWSGGGPHLCSKRGCAFDLRKATGETSAPPPVVAVLHRLLTLGRQAEDRHIPLPPGETLYLAFMLGRVVLGLERLGQPKAFVEKHRDRLVEVLTAGWQALDCWPDGFNALLAALRARQDQRKGRYGLQKQFGGLLYVLKRLRTLEIGAPVAEEFARYLAGQDDLAVKASWMKRYGSPEAAAHRHMTLNEARQYLNVSVPTMMRLAERENLYLVPPSGQGAPARLRADLLKALKERRERLMI